jgi:hypothetical protein
MHRYQRKPAEGHIPVTGVVASYAYNPLRWLVEGDKPEEPPQDRKSFMCPIADSIRC